MLRLHGGHLRPASLAGAALAVSVALVGVAAGPSAADSIGGDQLGNPKRTVALLPGADPLPSIWAETWIIADATTGDVLAQKGSHIRRAPASTLKMLTALAVMPHTSPETEWVATERAAGIYGARVGLRPGRTYTLDQLWYAVFLPSANDAAIAVAQANGGVRATVAQMNAIAHELNARDTTAKNPHGLDSPGQLSSAYDLALIARAGLKRPDFAGYAGTARAQFPNMKGKGSHTIYTTNRLLLSGWRGVIGVKTGFTSGAGRTYVGAANRGGRTLLVSLMGIHEASETAARKLLRWGFDNAEQVTPIGTLVDPGALPVDPVPGPTATAQPVSPAGDDGGSPSVAGSSPEPASLSSAAAVGALLLAGAAGAALVARRRVVRPRGRHSA